NGYFRFDRSEKETGFGDIVPGMSLNDLHSDIYISTGNEISRSVRPNEMISMPLFLSSMTDKNYGEKLNLKIKLYGVDAIGQEKTWRNYVQIIDYKPWIQTALEPVMIQMPDEKAVVIVSLILEDSNGKIINRNFTSFVVEADSPTEINLQNGSKAKLVSFDPKNFSEAKWSKKQWNVMEGAKINGAGAGYFEYNIKLPANFQFSADTKMEFWSELSAKQLFAKDMDKKLKGNEEYMLGAIAEPSQNPNSYPMTDTSRFPSEVKFSFNGISAENVILPNDPADSRGILSWHYQIQDKKLREPGSYGYLTKVKIPQQALDLARNSGEIKIRMEVSNQSAGGLAIYGEKFGRYPMNPSLIITGN
ncbi:MAG: glycoside hydrolase family 2, partial [Bacteroidota bacterium]